MPYTDPPKRKSTGKPKRRASADTLHAINGAVSRERDALPADSPRRRVSLPALKFMRDPDVGGAA